MAELCPPLPSHCGGPGLPLMERWSCPSLTSEFLGGVVQVSSRRLHHTPIIHQPEEDKKKKIGSRVRNSGMAAGLSVHSACATITRPGATNPNLHLLFLTHKYFSGAEPPLPVFPLLPGVFSMLFPQDTALVQQWRGREGSWQSLWALCWVIRARGGPVLPSSPWHTELCYCTLNPAKTGGVQLPFTDSPSLAGNSSHRDTKGARAGWGWQGPPKPGY